jgi:hypothetical protein
MSAIADLGTHVHREVTVAGVSNALFNGVIAWLLLRGGGQLTLAGERSYAADIVATAFILPFIVTLIVIPLMQRKRRKGALPGVVLNSAHWLEAFLMRFPRGLATRALCLGAAGTLLFAPITLLPLWLLGVDSFTPLGFAIFKGAWAGLLAAALTPPMLLLAAQEN